MSNERASPVVERPPKLYIDTNHLINIADLRHNRPLRWGSPDAYAFVDRCIRQHFGIILNPHAALEWVEGKATKKQRTKSQPFSNQQSLNILLSHGYLYTPMKYWSNANVNVLKSVYQSSRLCKYTVTVGYSSRLAAFSRT